MTARFALPFGDGLEPETCEMQRSGVLVAYQLHHVVLVFQTFQAGTDVLFVERTQHFVVLVVELFRHEDAFVARKRHRFGEVGLVHIVDRTPRTVHPMGARFENVVLEIVLVEQHNTLFGTLFCKFVKARPIPLVGLVKVVKA